MGPHLKLTGTASWPSLGCNRARHNHANSGKRMETPTSQATAGAGFVFGTLTWNSMSMSASPCSTASFLRKAHTAIGSLLWARISKSLLRTKGMPPGRMSSPQKPTFRCPTKTQYIIAALQEAPENTPRHNRPCWCTGLSRTQRDLPEQSACLLCRSSAPTRGDLP